MKFVRTGLIITGLLLSWTALRAPPTVLVGLLHGVVPIAHMAP